MKAKDWQKEQTQEGSGKKKKVNWLKSLLSHEEDHSPEFLRLLRLYEYALEELQEKLRNF